MRPIRATIDVDSLNPLKLLWVLFKGFIKLHRLPDVIRKSSGGHGWHLIWRKEARTLPEVNRVRRFIGDDERRVYLDSCSPARIPQILFTQKEFIPREELDART